MSHKTFETNPTVIATPQQPACELPSLDRIRTQAIMAAILYVGQKPTYDPKSYRHEEEVKTCVKLATELPLQIEQEEHDYLRRCSENEMYLWPSVQSEE